MRTVQLARWAPLVLAGLIVALPAAAQDDQRAERLRQLEAFEKLLTDTVQDRVTITVNTTVDAAREDGESDEPLVVKVGRPLAAHGLYLEGYGVMFSIQTPQVSVIPQSFEAVLAQPRAMLRFQSTDAPMAAKGVIELRTEMLDRSLEDLIVLLERDQGELHEVRVGELEELKVTLEKIREDMAETEAPLPPTPQAPEAQARTETEAQARAEARAQTRGEEALASARRNQERIWVESEGRAGRAPSRYEIYYRDVLEHRHGMQEVLQRNHVRIAAAVNQAVLRTLADYGAVLKGLDDEDRVAIVVLPPNTWTFARGTRAGSAIGVEENVVSVRYGDVREHLNGRIDYEEFARRADIRTRLGLATPTAPDPEQN